MAFKDEDKLRLKMIVTTLVSRGESDDVIRAVAARFKQKYDVPEPTLVTGTGPEAIDVPEGAGLTIREQGEQGLEQPIELPEPEPEPEPTPFAPSTTAATPGYIPPTPPTGRIESPAEVFNPPTDLDAVAGAAPEAPEQPVAPTFTTGEGTTRVAGEIAPETIAEPPDEIGPLDVPTRPFTPEEEEKTDRAVWRERMEKNAPEFLKNPVGAAITGIADQMAMGLIDTPESETAATTEPGAFGGAKLVTAIGQAIGLNAPIAKATTKLAASPFLQRLATRVATSIALDAPRKTMDVATGKQKFEDAFWDLAQNAGAAAISILPEVYMPANALQLIGQPAVDLAWLALTDAGKGRELNAEWLAENLPSLAVAGAFAVVDVASGERFRVEQKGFRKEISDWVKGKGKQGLRIEPEAPVAAGKAVAAPEPVKQVPDELLNPTKLFDEDIRTEKDPQKKQRLLRARKRMEDDVVEGVYKFDDARELVRHMDENDVPYAYVRGDGRELKAWNSKNKNVHADTDKEIIQVWGDVYRDRIKQEGGIMTREGGDEFIIVLPNKTQAEAETFMNSVDADAQQKIQELGLDAIPSAKGEYNGLPMGTGYIDWGVTEPIKGKYGDMDRLADERMAARKLEIAIDKAEEHGYNVTRSQTGEVVGFEPAKTQQEVRPPQESRTGADPAKAVKKQRPTGKPKGTKPAAKAAKPAQQKPLKAAKPKKKVTPKAVEDPDSQAAKAVVSQNQTAFKGEPTPAQVKKKYPQEFKAQQDAAKNPEVDTRLRGNKGLEVSDTPEPTPSPKQPKSPKRVSGQSGAAGPGKDLRIEKGDDAEAQALQAFEDASERKLKQKFKEAKTGFWSNFATNWLDRQSKPKRDLINNKGEGVVRALELSAGASAVAKADFKHAVDIMWKTIPRRAWNAFHSKLTGERVIALEKTKDADFKNPGGFPGKSWKKKFDALRKKDPETWNAVEKGAETWKKFNDDHIVDELMMRRYKLIDEKTAEALKKTFYSERRFLKYIDPKTTRFDANGNKISVPDSGIKRLDGGSEGELFDNHYLLLADRLGRLHTRGMRNLANLELLKWTKDNPENEIGIIVETPKSIDLEQLDPFDPDMVKMGDAVYGKEPEGMTRVFAVDNGSPVAMLLPDKFAEGWTTGSGDSDATRSLTRTLKWASGTPVLKAMATGYNPGFALANVFRDLPHIWFTTKEFSPIAPIAVAEMAKDMAEVALDVVRNRGIVDKYVKHGGMMDFLSYEGRLLNRKPWDKPSGSRDMLEKVQEILGWAGEKSELLTRTALMNRALKNRAKKAGISAEEAWKNETMVAEAVHVARSYLDFSLSGASAKTVNNFVPYFTAGINGTKGIVKAWKTDPALAAFKTGQLMSFASGLAYWNRAVNPEAWDTISEREKTVNFVFTTPWSYKDKGGEVRHIYFAIPKDQGQRIIAAMGEEVAEFMHGRDPNVKRMAMAAGEFLPVDAAAFIPPTMDAYIVYNHNFDTWRSEPVWNGRKNITPAFEAYGSTPDMWKKIGNSTKGFSEEFQVSPERLRRAVGKVLPTNVYTIALEASFKGLKDDMSEKEWEEYSAPFVKHFKTAAESPISRRFVRQTWPQGKKKQDVLKKADELGVPTHTEEGRTLTTGELSTKVRNAELKLGNKRKRLDDKFDRLAEQATKGVRPAEKKFLDDMFKLRREDPVEFDRISRRIRKRQPDVLEGRLVAAHKLKSPQGWADYFDSFEWLRNASEEQKKLMRDEVGPGYAKYVRKAIKRTIDIGGQMGRFEQQKKMIRKEFVRGLINKTEMEQRVSKVDEQREDYIARVKDLEKVAGIKPAE